MRSRRNTRRKNIIIETITNKNFIIISSILLAIIIFLFGAIEIRHYVETKEIAKQAKELEKQTGEIFKSMDESIIQASNPSGELTRVFKAKIVAVGDILCQSTMINDAKTSDGNYNFSHMFSNITQYVKDSDLALGTLETNFTDNKYSGSGKYNSPIEFLKAVKESGISMVSLAHNHALDYGMEGLNTTVTKVKEQELSIIGLPNNIEGEEKDFSGIIKDVQGIKIAFLSYTYGLSNEAKLTEEEKMAVNIYSKELALNDLEYAKQNSNYIIAIMHWGNENSSQINEKQSEITGFLVENGIDMILGSHPSVVQPMQIIQNSEGKNILVAYSLGNYISALSTENSDVQIILNITITRNSSSDKAVLQAVNYTPIYMLDNGTKAQNRYELTDMKALIRDYTNGDTSKISKKTYNTLVKKLTNLQNTINNE